MTQRAKRLTPQCCSCLGRAPLHRPRKDNPRPGLQARALKNRYPPPPDQVDDRLLPARPPALRVPLPLLPRGRVPQRRQHRRPPAADPVPLNSNESPNARARGRERAPAA